MTKHARRPLSFLAVTAMCAGALSLTTLGGEEAQAAPDPQTVQRYLAQLEVEAEQATVRAEDAKRRARGEQIRKMVEGAAVRAPSGSVIAGIEAALAEKIG